MVALYEKGTSTPGRSAIVGTSVTFAHLVPNPDTFMDPAESASSVISHLDGEALPFFGVPTRNARHAYPSAPSKEMVIDDPSAGRTVHGRYVPEHTCRTISALEQKYSLISIVLNPLNPNLESWDDTIRRTLTSGSFSITFSIEVCHEDIPFRVPRDCLTRVAAWL
jgi:hypothetical protein